MSLKVDKKRPGSSYKDQLQSCLVSTPSLLKEALNPCQGPPQFAETDMYLYIPICIYIYIYICIYIPFKGALQMEPRNSQMNHYPTPKRVHAWPAPSGSPASELSGAQYGGLNGGFQKFRGLFGSPYNNNHGVLGSILGHPIYGNTQISTSISVCKI